MGRGTLSPNVAPVTVGDADFYITVGITYVNGQPVFELPLAPVEIMYIPDAGGQLEAVTYDNGGWETYNGVGTGTPITATASDVLVSVAGFSFDSSGNPSGSASPIAGSGFFEGVQTGYRSGTFTSNVTWFESTDHTYATFEFQLGFEGHTFVPYYIAQTTLDI